MKTIDEGYLLRIFIGDRCRHAGKPLYEWIVIQAREFGLAGATVLRGTMGYGANSRIKTSKILRLSEDLPIIIELVDAEEKLKRFLATIDATIGEGLATFEKATVLFYRSKATAPRDKNQ
jgi:PII-like signaling protein